MLTYSEQLRTPLWQKLRVEVLKRDGHKCQKCFNKIYLNDEAVGVGFVNSKPTNHFIGINIFEESPLFLKINEVDVSRLSLPCILYYKISEQKWINFIAMRHLTPMEISSYIEEPKLRTVKYIEEQLEKKGIRKNNFAKIIDAIMFDSSLELETGTNSTLTKLQENWTQNEWTFVNGLHIHHNYYQRSKMAWEYPFEALTSLCWICHEDLHKNSKIEVRDEQGIVIEYKMACPRCHGAGWFPEYTHVEYGECFLCRGSKFLDD